MKTIDEIQAAVESALFKLSECCRTDQAIVAKAATVATLECLGYTMTDDGRVRPPREWQPPGGYERAPYKGPGRRRGRR